MKMKIRNFFIILSALAVTVWSCDTSGNIDDPTESYFIKYYGVDGNQEAADMLPLSDGSVLLLGTTTSNDFRSVYLVKADSKGQLMWERTYTGTSDVAVDIEPTIDGNFIILARYEKTEADHDIRLILVSPDGTELNNVTYGMSQNKKESPRSVTPLSDGGFIVTGGTQQDDSPSPSVNPDDYSNIFHFRCDSRLVFDNVTWSELYGPVDKIDVGIKTYQQSTSDFVVFGYSNRKLDGAQTDRLSPIYYRISGGGTPSDHPTAIGDFNQNIESNFIVQVDPALGAGYLMLGTKVNNLGTKTYQASKLKSPVSFDAAQDEQFNEEISSITNPVDAIAAATSLKAPAGFLLLGEEVRTEGTKNISLTKIDQSAIVRWSVSLGSEEENDKAAAVAELPNGKILVLGTVAIGDNQSKMALFKLNSEGRLHD